MPLKHSLKLIKKAKEEETKEYYYRLWLVRYPYYDKNNYESFMEFYEKALPKEIKYDTRSKEELMNEIADIENKFRKGGN